MLFPGIPMSMYMYYGKRTSKQYFVLNTWIMVPRCLIFVLGIVKYYILPKLSNLVLIGHIFCFTWCVPFVYRPKYWVECVVNCPQGVSNMISSLDMISRLERSVPSSLPLQSMLTSSWYSLCVIFCSNIIEKCCRNSLDPSTMISFDWGHLPNLTVW